MSIFSIRDIATLILLNLNPRDRARMRSVCASLKEILSCREMWIVTEEEKRECFGAACVSMPSMRWMWQMIPIDIYADNGYILQIACAKGNLEMVKFLFYRFRIDDSNHWGDIINSSLSVAAKKGFLDAIKWVFRKIARPRLCLGMKLFREACSGGQIRTAKWLTTYFDDVRTFINVLEWFETIEANLNHGHVTIVTWLFNNCRQMACHMMDKDFYRILENACLRNHHRTVKLMIKSSRIYVISTWDRYEHIAHIKRLISISSSAKIKKCLAGYYELL